MTQGAREDRPAALLGWSTGDSGTALYTPEGVHICNTPDARTLCRLLNIRRLARLRRQRAMPAGDEPRASRA